MSLSRSLRAGFAWLVVVKATVVLGTLAACLREREAALRVGRLWARVCLFASGCPATAHVDPGVDLDGPLVLLANHQSALDIPLVMAGLPEPLRAAFWSRDDLFEVPFLGRAMRAMGFVAVDRTDRRTAAAVLAASLALIRAGRSVLVFPEETYGPVDHLLPFQRGAFLLALKAGVPILPVGIRGTAEAFPPGARTISPRALELRFGRPVPTAGLGPSARAGLEAEVRAAIADLSGKTS